MNNTLVILAVFCGNNFGILKFSGPCLLTGFTIKSFKF